MDFEGPSPDEIALLRGSQFNFDIFLKSQNSKHLIISNNGHDLEIEKLFFFNFDSDRKMMSVLVRLQEKYFLMVKGADNTIAERALNGNTDQLPSYFTECIDFYLEAGLRVMFVAVKVLSKEECTKFLEEVKEMENDPKYTSEEIYQKKREVEEGLTIIGATAIEDKLQEELKETIEVMKIAEIKIWMITGDKLETAKNIAYASGLFAQNIKPDIFDQERLETMQLKFNQKSQKKKFNIFRWRRNPLKDLNIVLDEKIPHQGALQPRVSL